MMKALQIKLKVKLGWNINANEQIGTRITAKYLVKREGIYPYISARNIRYGIRLQLLDKGYEIDWYTWDNNKKELKDSADPIKYIDNDIFGYMYPISDIGAIKRFSPIWTSPWLADEPVDLSIDQGGRFPRREGHPMIMENEVFPPVEGTLYFVITDRIGRYDAFEVFSAKTKEFIEKLSSSKGKGSKGKSKENIDDSKFVEFNNYIEKGYVKKENDNQYVLVKDLKNKTREDRIKDVLTIILKDGWIPARKAQYLYLPEYIKAEIYAVEGIKSFSLLEKRELIKDININDIKEKKIIIDYKEDTEQKINNLINNLTNFLL